MAPSAYISLVLDADTKATLQTCIERIQASSPVPLDAMLRADMHMTLVFLGANLRGLPPAKRSELQAIITVFREDADAAATSSALEFERLELFPPTKRNLLVARYKIAGRNLEAVRKLQAECFGLGMVSMEEEEGRLKGEEFVAHVTLGKFRGMKAEQSTGVERAVRKLNEGLEENVLMELGLPFREVCLCGRS